MLDPETETEAEHYAILQPETVEHPAYTGVLFMFGGLLWIYVVSDQLQNFHDEGRFVSPNGTVTIAKDTKGVAKQLLDKAVTEPRRVGEQKRKLRDSS